MNSIEQISLATSYNNEMNDFLVSKQDSYTNYSQMKTVALLMANIVYSTPIMVSIDLYTNQPAIRFPGVPVNFKDFDSIKEENWSSTLAVNDFGWFPERIINNNGSLTPVVSLYRKVYTNADKYEGLLVFNIKSSTIRDLLSDAKENEHTQNLRVMMDSSGRVFFSSGNYTLTTEIQEFIHHSIDNSKIGYVRIPFVSGDGTISDSLIVWSRLFDSGWILAEITPWKQIKQETIKIAMILTSVGLMAIVIALCLTILLSKQFTKPIRILLREMTSFNMSSSLSSKEPGFPRDYQNEFGTMFFVYEKMLAHNKELYASLESRYVQQKETEIKTLQAMINPHFLYNTLDQLNWMALEEGNEKISHVLELMGRMFRIGLSNGEPMIKVEQELEHMECYMEMQKIRLGNHIEFDIHVPETLMNVYILKLTLQPFVENAVIHGLHGLKDGKITIRAVETTKGILFTVSDNGHGMREGWQQQSNRMMGGYGIRNVKERIDAYFYGKYGIEIQSQLGNGTTVCILLPKIENLDQWRNQNVESRNHR
jgi:two-component system sensor histidine kinase YesM